MPPLVPRWKRLLKGSKNDNQTTNKKTHEVGGSESATGLRTVKVEHEPPRSPSPSVALEKTTAEPSADLKPDQRSQVDPWTRAFEIFQERNEGQELLAVYKNHLTSFHGNASDIDSNILRQNTVKKTVNELLENREKRQWKISIGNNDIKIRSQFEKLAKFLLWSDGFVKTAVSTQPYAALAWSGVSLILQVSTTGLSQNEDMLDGFNAILDLQMYWQIFEQQYLDAEHQQSYRPVIEPLAKLYSYMIEYQAEVLHHLDSSQASRAWADIRGSSAWSGSTENIKKLDEFCRTFISLGESSEIRKYREEQLQVLLQTRNVSEKILQQMADRERDSRERDVLEDLATAAGDYKRYKDRNPMRMPGTCEWFLQDERFTSWRSTGSSDLLWVTAQPGCGKSVLSKSLIDEGHLDAQTTFTITSESVISSPKPVVAYFFFKEGGEGKMNGAHALSALLHQIFTSPFASHTIAHALPLHKAHGSTLTSKFSELWQILVDLSTASEENEIICVLDALDECDKESRRWILENLESFYSDEKSWSKSNLKFLVTSRPISQLEYSFEKFPENAAYMRLDGDEKHEQIREEIDLFIDAEVEVLTRKFSDRVRSAEKIKTRLKSMENRTYLWLYLTLDYIKSDPAKFARQSDVEKLLSNLPENVSEAYERMLSGKRNDQRTEILLQLVLAAETPLFLVEASIALTIGLQERKPESHATLMDEIWTSEAFEDVVKDSCGLLINIQDEKLSFIHQTAREFLTKKPKGAKRQRDHLHWEGIFGTQQPHNTMLQICLDYLLIPDLGGPAKADDQLEFIDVSSYPFLPYSSDNWSFHFEHCEDSAFVAHLDRVRILCDPDGRWAWPWTCTNFNIKLWNYKQSGWTLLGLASYLGMKRFASLLLEEGVDIDEGLETPLQLAAEQGHQEIVRMLLENGADASIKNTDLETALMHACYKGHHSVAKMLLDHESNSNDHNEARGEALQSAISEGHQKVVELLFKYQVDINLIGSSGSTALQIAAGKLENYEMIDTLLDHGADINASSGERGAAIQSAAFYGDQILLEKLIRRGADIDAGCGTSSGTALMAAAWESHQQAFELLIRHGANVNGQGRFGTALSLAALKANQEMVEMLLAHGADVNIQAESGYTALHQAAAGGSRHIVEMLLRHGVNINAQAQDGETVLHRALSRGHQDVVNLLIDRGAILNIQDGYGRTELHIASSVGNQDIVKTLIDHGVDLNVQDVRGESALSCAVKAGRDPTLIELLLDHGAKISPSSGGETALHTAANWGYDEAVEKMLNRQIDVNILWDGKTALYEASARGHSGVMKILFDHGADVNLGGAGKTPLSIAAEEGRDDVVEVLLNHGAELNQEEDCDPPFFKASENGHLKILELLLDHGFDVNHECSSKTALLIAVEKWEQKIVELLLERGADANQKPVLHKAAASGLPRMVEILIEYGAEPDLEDEHDHTAIYYAAANGYERVVEILLEHEIGSTHEALQAAKENKHTKVVEMLEKI